MKAYLRLLILCLFISSSLLAQNVGQKGDTLINYKDINGLKHGKWTKKYKNGKTAYNATFKKDKLIGPYQRFYMSGKLSMEVDYDQNESGFAKLYYDNGVLGAEGQYINRNVKDGLWKYYGVDGRLATTVEYKNGVLNGKEIKYWKNGNKLEQKTWTEGKMTGVWYRYYENGKDQLQAKMENGVRQGGFLMFHNTGRLYIKGKYHNDIRVGQWVFYDRDDKIIRDTEYKNGVASDQKEYNDKATQMVKEWEEMKGLIPDPNIDNMFKYDKTYGPLSK
jgi:antitoxin component YwqK of YwqJK toxin-antitoxin module